MYESDDEERIPEEIELVDEEPIGPAPTEYRWALTFAILFILGVLAWSLLQH